MVKGFIYSSFISLAIIAIWYALEFRQFGTFQWGRKCDDIVSGLYFIALWIAFSKW